MKLWRIKMIIDSLCIIAAYLGSCLSGWYSLIIQRLNSMRITKKRCDKSRSKLIVQRNTLSGGSWNDYI
jgi:hypothetical protein